MAQTNTDNKDDFPPWDELKVQSWFYLMGPQRQQQGPFSVDDLVDSYDIGDIDDNTLVWCAALKNWIKIGDLTPMREYLKSMLEQPPVIPPIEDIEQQQQQQQQLSLQPRKLAHPPPPNEVTFDTERDVYTYKEPQTGIIYDFDDTTNSWIERNDKPIQQQQQQPASEARPASEEGASNDSKKRKSEAGEAEEDKDNKKKKKRQRNKKSSSSSSSTGWVEPAVHTSVYVTGLPHDITPEEFASYFTQCGIIKQDPETDQPRVKLYRDANGNLKGDGLVVYLKEPSVKLAIDLLNETEIRPGYLITVQEAKFEKKEGVQRAPQSKSVVGKKKKKQERALDWTGTEREVPAPRVVIIKHMFDPKEFETDPTLEADLREDITSEAAKLGEVDVLHIFKNHPEGVVSIQYSMPHAAEECVRVWNGRWFGGRQLVAHFWDGKTDYGASAEELRAEEDEEAALEEFSKFIEGAKTPESVAPEQ